MFRIYFPNRSQTLHGTGIGLPIRPGVVVWGANGAAYMAYTSTSMISGPKTLDSRPFKGLLTVSLGLFNLTTMFDGILVEGPNVFLP